MRISHSIADATLGPLYASLGYRDVGIAPRHVTGTVELRTGPIEVDDTIVTLAKPLAARS
jgi:hypothetical protein